MWRALPITGITIEDAPDFDSVVREREAQVLRTAYRILGNWADAEDAAQEVFTRLHRRGTGFANDAAMGAWIYRVTVNLCLDRVRAPARSGPLPLDLASSGASAEAEAMRGQDKRRLDAALSELPARERAAIVLREIEGLSTAETAAALGTAESTVRVQIANAMARLREILTRSER